MRDTLRSIGLAKVAGFLLTGEDTVRNAARGGKVKLIILSEDAGSGAVKRADQAAQLCGVKVLTIGCSKFELGAAAGLGTVAIAAITDTGFAKMLIGKIEQSQM